MSAHNWTASALCAQADPESFFPERGSTPRPAQAICGRCIVSTDCLEYALNNGPVEGVWGGTTQRERLALTAARGITPKSVQQAEERRRFALIALARGVEVEPLADHLGVDAMTVYRMTRETA